MSQFTADSTDSCATTDSFAAYGIPDGTDLIAVVSRSLDATSESVTVTTTVSGPVVDPDRTVTLALPKTGLDDGVGTLFLADIGITAVVYDRVGIDYESPFGDDWVELVGTDTNI
jgi:hypothetical protein